MPAVKRRRAHGFARPRALDLLPRCAANLAPSPDGEHLMQRSTDRILVTHTGSLPRPQRLTDLYARRSRGQAVDEVEVARAGREAVRHVVAQQAAVGIDVGNNGEQQRNSFFLYLTERLTGLGGSWDRPTRADMDRYPLFRQRFEAEQAAKVQVSLRGQLPKAIGEVRYVSDRAMRGECEDFAAALQQNPKAFVEPF